MGRYAFNSQRRVRINPIPTTLDAQTKLAISNSASDPMHGVKEVRQMSATEFHVYGEGKTKKGILVARYRDGKSVG